MSFKLYFGNKSETKTKMDNKMETYNIHEVEINLHPNKILDNSPYDVCILTSIMNGDKVGDLVQLVMYKDSDRSSNFCHIFAVDEIMHDLGTITRFMD